MELLQDVCKRIQFRHVNTNTGANRNGINFSVFVLKLNPHRLLCFCTVTFQIHILKQALSIILTFGFGKLRDQKIQKNGKPFPPNTTTR